MSHGCRLIAFATNKRMLRFLKLRNTSCFTLDPRIQKTLLPSGLLDATIEMPLVNGNLLRLQREPKIPSKNLGGYFQFSCVLLLPV